MEKISFNVYRSEIFLSDDKKKRVMNEVSVYLLLDQKVKIFFLVKMFRLWVRRQPAEKNLAGNTVLPKFCDVCPNHDFLELYGCEKKICLLKFREKIKKRLTFNLNL